MQTQKQYKKVSIIISCWNTGECLIPLLDSIFAQTYPNIEVITVDDGSKDDTLKRLTDYQKNHSNMIVAAHEVNKGLSAGRNTGFKYSTGDYIIFCDSDDIVTPDYVQSLVENLEKTDSDLAICGFKRVAENKKLKLGRGEAKHKLHVFEGEQIVPELFRQKTFDVCVWNKLYKRSILQENGLEFYEKVEYAEDIAFNYFYFKNCKRIVYDSKVCYFYIRRGTGLVKSPINARKLSSFLDVERIVEDSEKNSRQYLAYAHGWRALVSLEFLYYIFKFKYKDEKLAQKLYANMKDGLPYLRKAKRMVWYRRYLVGVAMVLVRILIPQVKPRSSKKQQLQN